MNYGRVLTAYFSSIIATGLIAAGCSKGEPARSPDDPSDKPPLRLTIPDSSTLKKQVGEVIVVEGSVPDDYKMRSKFWTKDGERLHLARSYPMELGSRPVRLKGKLFLGEFKHDPKSLEVQTAGRDPNWADDRITWYPSFYFIDYSVVGVFEDEQWKEPEGGVIVVK